MILAVVGKGSSNVTVNRNGTIAPILHGLVVHVDIVFNGTIGVTFCTQVVPES
jgi:hypothetical protein